MTATMRRKPPTQATMTITTLFLFGECDVVVPVGPAVC
jgi:hypothetical protein